VPTPSESRLTRVAVAVVLILAPVAVFWRPGLPFFFIRDDWTALIQMSASSWGRYLTTPDGEQWFPVFHLIFYPLVAWAGERYGLLLLLNCLGIGLGAYLVFLFLRRWFALPLSAAAALLYSLAAAHHALAWNAFYLCYLLSLIFFLVALLLTDSYGRQPSGGKVCGIALCAWLSILSHNYTLSGVWALPLYLLCLDGPRRVRSALILSAALGAVYVMFTLGYFAFAGLPALTSHNQSILSRLPGPRYAVHMFYGAILSPFLYIFWGHNHFPVWTYVAASLVLGGCLAVIWSLGEARDRRLALWAASVNLLPFVLVSLARYHRAVTQAFVARYAIFTLLGAGLVAALAWSLLARRWRQTWWFRGGTVLLVAAILAGQGLALPLWQRRYLEMSRTAAACYRQLTAAPTPDVIPPEAFSSFCPTAHPQLSPAQAQAIRQFLQGLPQVAE